MPKRLRFPKWVVAFECRARRRETSAGLSIHHRRLACEALEGRYLLSFGSELGGASAADPKTLVDLPVAAQYAISSVIGQDQTAYHAAAGAAGLTLANPANGFTARIGSEALQLIQESQLRASNGADGDDFGTSIAISGDTVVVGAPHATVQSNYQGAVYVFRKPASGWANMTETAILTASDGDVLDYFGTSVAIDGDTVVVGAPHAASGSPNPWTTGAAYVFQKPAGGWKNMVETAKLAPSDRGSDEFGTSVGISGDTVVVGVPYVKVGNNAYQGAVYVYQKPASGWVNATETTWLVASDGAFADNLGTAVAISGDTVVAGVPNKKVGDNLSQGKAYVFQKSGGGWLSGTETAQLTASDGGALGDFGASVAVSGDTIVVGAPWAGPTLGGMAYVFERSGAAWSTMTQTGKLVASDAAGGHFGTSVAISGNTAVVGAPWAQVSGSSAYGETYVFRKPGTRWATVTEVRILTASDGFLGENYATSLGIDGATVVVGANMPSGVGPGEAYVYETYQTTWPTPAPITYGTALDSTQLCATATVPGSFAYSPPAGTVLGAGIQTLSATFTPADPDNSEATIQVALQVDKATPTIDWPTPAAIPYGTALGSEQLNASASWTVGGTLQSVAGTFVYVPDMGTVLEVGSHTISVTFTPADATNYATAAASVTLEVVKATPSITWANPAAITYGTALGGAQLNATADVPGFFVYTPAEGTVLDAGNQTLSATFWPADWTHYATADATVTLVVQKAAPTVTWAAPAAITYGTALDSTQLCATANVPGAFAYTPPAGTVLGAGDQTLSTTFTPTDSANYATVSANVTLVVDKAAPSITWPTPAAITYGTALGDAQLGATTSVPGAFAYAPAAGTVLGAGVRTLSTTFTPTDTANYTQATASVALQVDQATPSLDWATPAAITYGTALDGTQLNAGASWLIGETLQSVAGTFVYTPGAPAVLGAGSHTLSVTFTPTDTADYTTAAADVTLEVSPATPTIEWAAPTISYGTPLGGSQLNAMALWMVGPAQEEVEGAYVYTPAAGTVFEVGSHPLSVTFTPANAADYTPATANVILQVDPAAPAIAWPMPAAITYGTALSGEQLCASASWMIGQTPVSVDGTFAYSPDIGTLLAAGSHTLSVTFTPTDTVHYVPATASVTLQVDRAGPSIDWAPAAIVYGTALGETELNAMASVPGSFTYSPAPGTVLNAGSQTLSVTFVPTDTSNYLAATTSVTLQVDKATPAIHWTPEAIAYGTVLAGSQFNANASWVVGETLENVAGTFAYTPAAGAVLGAGEHALSTTFTPTDTDNYTAATVSVALQVDKAEPMIHWTPEAIAYGTALGAAQLNAAASWTVGGTPEIVAGTFAYEPSAGTVLGAGDQNLSATFTPTDSDNYTTATASVILQVGKATPTITWAAPTAITYGMPLGSTQLDATASVPGSFVYTPPAGTILDAGIRTLSAAFTPEDAENYTTATANTTLEVAKAAPLITIIPYSVTYDGMVHTAGGTARGVRGEDLGSGLNLVGTRHINAGSYPSDPWSFAGNSNYQSASGTVANTIAKANATIAVTPYHVVYDGKPHTAAGTAIGVAGENFSEELNLLATTHANAGDYPNDAWSFAGNANYTSASGTVANSIAKAAASIEVRSYNVIYDGTAHTAIGTARGVLGEDLSSSLDLSGTTHTNAGSYANDSWTFAGNINYQGANGSVTSNIAKANAAITVADYWGVYDKLPHGPTATVRGVLGENWDSLWRPGASFTSVPGGTSHWTFDGNENYNPASGDAAVVISPNTQMGPEIIDLAVVPAPARTAPKVTATAHTANTGGSNIVAAEYFIDKPGKSGKGIRMAASDKTFASPSELVAAKLGSLFGRLRRGLHTVYVHAKDATGKWGELVLATFVKDTLGPRTSKPVVAPSPANVPPTVTATIDDAFTGGSLIAAAEYFIDRPGKSGKGTPMAAAFNTATQTVTATLDATRFNVLKPGRHTIYVHGKDAAGNWGKLVAATFVKATPSPAASNLGIYSLIAAAAPSPTAKSSEDSAEAR